MRRADFEAEIGFLTKEEGARFHLVEGQKIVADGIVTRILDLFVDE
jgi:hypothetical protein